jgi:hypothetical protein
MGQLNAGVWLILTSIYFIIFISVVASVSSLGLDFEDGTISDGDISSLTGQSVFQCDTPRYAIRGDGSVYITRENNLDCRSSYGANNDKLCNQINGCTWENVTSGFWFFADTTETCNGDINLNFYDSENDGLCKGLTSNDCFILGCTYYETNPYTSDISSPKEIMGLIFQLFTFRYDFGFSGLLNIIISIFFMFIPLLIWIMSLYFMLPFAH